MAQAAADNQSSVIGRPEADRESQPQTIKDTLQKMRIEKEKRDFERMVERSEEAVKIATELETALAQNGRLTEKEKAQLASVEKLAKQIRNGLGGGDDDNSDDRAERPASTVVEAVRSLRSSAEALFKEIKKTTRFTISATAIQSSNAVMRLARFMRIAD